jgi:hypothetical protein
MKRILNITAITIVLLFLFITDIPLLPVELVPEAQAIFGVRRRTAVIAYSAGKANASAAASQQQAAATQQQTAAAKQQTAAAQTYSGVPLGTVVEALPPGCIAVTVGKSQYQDCDGSFYRAAFQGNKLLYVVVEKPL